MDEGDPRLRRDVDERRAGRRSRRAALADEGGRHEQGDPRRDGPDSGHSRPFDGGAGCRVQCALQIVAGEACPAWPPRGLFAAREGTRPGGCTPRRARGAPRPLRGSMSAACERRGRVRRAGPAAAAAGPTRGWCALGALVGRRDLGPGVGRGGERQLLLRRASVPFSRYARASCDLEIGHRRRHRDSPLEHLAWRRRRGRRPDRPCPGGGTRSVCWTPSCSTRSNCWIASSRRPASSSARPRKNRACEKQRVRVERLAIERNGPCRVAEPTLGFARAGRETAPGRAPGRAPWSLRRGRSRSVRGPCRSARASGAPAKNAGLRSSAWRSSALASPIMVSGAVLR